MVAAFGAGLADGFRTLREREFRLLFTGTTLSLLGDRLVPVALAFATLDLTGSAADLGWVLAAGWIPQIALVLFGGVAGDRLSRRAMMLGADLVRASSQAALAALLVSGNARLWHLLALQAVRGAASAFFNPASTGLLPQTVSAERLHAANALRGLAMWGSGIVGPGLSGGLVAAVGPGWAIAVDAATFVWSAAFLFRLRLPALAERTAQPRILHELAEGWREFSSRTWLWAIVLVAAMGNAVIASPYDVLGPVVAKAELGGAGAWGLIGTCGGIGAFLGGLAVLSWRPRRPLLVSAIGGLAFAVPNATLAAHAPLAVVSATSFVRGLGLAVFGVLWETTLQREVPAAALSRVSAYDWFGSIALIPLGTAGAGALGGSIGITSTLWGSFAIGLLLDSAILLVPSIRRLEDAAYTHRPWRRLARSQSAGEP